MTNTAYGFKASWKPANGNYLARKGVRPGSTSPIVTYSVNYQPKGNSYLAIYGWTQNPLIEYYIVDSWGDWRPPGTNAIGTVTVDGGTYDIYQSLREQKPSIEGTKTFYQYWSVRRETEKRTSGTITVAPHFEAWKKFGLTMGTFYEVSLVIEGYNSSGTADVTVSYK
jgi:endo-1,4-beta-xylanase